MEQVKLKGKKVALAGHLPAIHIKARDFALVDRELKTRSLHEFSGKRKILATVPSLDTPTCSIMTKHLNEFGKKHPNFAIFVVSADLPFAQNRFCESENAHNVLTLSTVQDPEFGKGYGVLIQEGPLKGMLARAIFVLDEKDHVLYVELVSEVTEEPNYHKAFEIIQGHQKK